MSAIFSAMNGEPIASAYLITFATIIDTFDGAAARLLHATTDLGKQLDSLSDSVTVGVAPAVLVYAVFFRPWHSVGIGIGAFWTLAVLTRLARFNVMPSDPSYFKGLPSPPAANILSGSVVFVHAVWHRYYSPIVALALMLVLAALMLSNVRFEKGSFFTPEQLIRSWRGRLALFACLFSAIVTWAGPFVVFSSLVLLALIREARTRRYRRARAWTSP